MSSVKVHVIGRLGADAEIKQTKQGKDYSKFTLAVDDFIGGKKETSWFAVVDFSENAKRRAEFLKKGSLIEVQGIESCRIYVDRNNQPQIARDIRSTHIDFIPTSSRNDKEETVDCGTFKPSSVKSEVTPPVTVAAVSSVSSNEDSLIDDLPF